MDTDFSLFTKINTNETRTFNVKHEIVKMDENNKKIQVTLDFEITFLIHHQMQNYKRKVMLNWTLLK